eukprot:COSAG01_NODE_21847_length_882_cov_1.356322_2_plen_47_part_01
MVSYTDFEDSWDYSEGAIPGREAFSRLITQLERPDGSGNVVKVRGNV